MIQITIKINGKKYKLVKETLLCEGCSFLTKKGDCLLSNKERRFYNANVCGKLGGIWKEATDDKNNQ